MSTELRSTSRVAAGPILRTSDAEVAKRSQRQRLRDSARSLTRIDPSDDHRVDCLPRLELLGKQNEAVAAVE